MPRVLCIIMGARTTRATTIISRSIPRAPTHKALARHPFPRYQYSARNRSLVRPYSQHMSPRPMHGPAPRAGPFLADLQNSPD
jgi:hypothetical protein